MEVVIHTKRDAINYIIPKVSTLCDTFTTELVGKALHSPNKYISMDPPMTTTYRRGDGRILLRLECECDSNFDPRILISLELITDKGYSIEIKYDTNTKDYVTGLIDGWGHSVEFDEFLVSPFNCLYLDQFLGFYRKLQKIIYDANMYVQFYERVDIKSESEDNENENHQTEC